MTKKKSRTEVIFEECGAIKKGHFELTSGRHSDVYLDKTLIYPDTRLVSSICMALVFKYYRSFSGQKIDVVVGPALGGIILSHRVADYLNNSCGREVLSLFTEKNRRGRQILKRGFQKLVAGKNVLIVDDILTTGGSVKQVIEEVEKAGGTVIGIEVVWNRGGVTSPFLYSLLQKKLEDWPKEECPLCKAGILITKEGKSTPLLN